MALEITFMVLKVFLLSRRSLQSEMFDNVYLHTCTCLGTYTARQCNMHRQCSQKSSRSHKAALFCTHQNISEGLEKSYGGFGR